MDYLAIVGQPDGSQRLFYTFREPGGWDFKVEEIVRAYAKQEFANIDACRIEVIEMDFPTQRPRLIWRTQNHVRVVLPREKPDGSE